MQHRADAAYRKVWQRDRARLLRNWPAESGLNRWLERGLPPAWRYRHYAFWHIALAFVL